MIYLIGFLANMLFGTVLLLCIDRKGAILKWALRCPFGGFIGLTIATTFWFGILYVWIKNAR